MRISITKIRPEVLGNRQKDRKTRGFAGYSPAQRFAVSSKGGRAKVPKGLAKLSPEERKEIARLGGLKHQDNKRKKEKEDATEEDSISSGD